MNLSKGAWLPATVAVMLAGCADGTNPLQNLSNGLAQVNRTLAAPLNSMPTALGPSLSAEEQAALNSNLTASLASRDATLRRMVAAAQPTIAAVLSKTACYQQSNDWAVLSMYASPNMYQTYLSAPWNSMPYAPKGRCLSILRTDAWSQPSMNSFRFRAVYYSAQSGESQQREYEFINLDGTWLLNHVLG